MTFANQTSMVQTKIANINIALLVDHPDLIPTLAHWFLREWGHISANRRQAHYAKLLTENLNRDKVPFTIIAFDGKYPVGTASLDANDLDTQSELTPWLASVVVAPEYRGKGIASILIKHIENEAYKMGIRTLYLWTEDADALFLKLGWRHLDKRRYHDTDIMVMEKKLESV